jgi:hypothetical protein
VGLLKGCVVNVLAVGCLDTRRKGAEELDERAWRQREWQNWLLRNLQDSRAAVDGARDETMSCQDRKMAPLCCARKQETRVVTSQSSRDSTSKFPRADTDSQLP